MARQETALRAGPHLTRRSPSKAGANLLLLFGFVLLLAGSAFIAGSRYSWQIDRVAKLVSGVGVENGVLLVGGLALIGLGSVGRLVLTALHRSSQPEQEPLGDDLRLLSEQMNTKLAQLRTSMLQVSEDLGAVAASQQGQFHKQAEHSGNPDHQQDALFRLAASLDKLNAHLDERIHGIDLLLRSGLENLAQVVHESRRFMEHRMGGSPMSTQGRRDDPHARVELQEHEPHQGEGSLAFFETMERLDALAGSGTPQPPSQRQQPRYSQAPFPNVQPGEALDSLLPDEPRGGRDERY